MNGDPVAFEKADADREDRSFIRELRIQAGMRE